jgi:hypothetical protein
VAYVIDLSRTIENYAKWRTILFQMMFVSHECKEYPSAMKVSR